MLADVTHTDCGAPTGFVVNYRNPADPLGNLLGPCLLQLRFKPLDAAVGLALPEVGGSISSVRHNHYVNSRPVQQSRALRLAG